MQKITVVSSGSWGTALAVLLAGNGCSVSLLSYSEAEAASLIKHGENKTFLPGIPLPPEVRVTADFAAALDSADIIVNTTPSKYIRETFTRIAEAVPKNAVIVNASKGLEDGTHLRISEVLSQILPNCEIAVLSGPSHAEEVSRGIPTAIVAASRDKTVAARVQNLFMSPTFRVYTSLDVIGVELGGALKNVIALAAGISDGMGYGDNTKAAIMTRGIAEITRLGVRMGALPATFAGLAGIGDLIVTCTSMHSRNRRCGILLGQGKTLNNALNEVQMVVEGVETAHAALLLANEHKIEMPIICEINKTLFDGKDPRLVLADLMQRDKTAE